MRTRGCPMPPHGPAAAQETAAAPPRCWSCDGAPAWGWRRRPAKTALGRAMASALPRVP